MAISGKTTVTASQMEKYFKAKGATYPAYYAETDAPTLEKFCQIYVEEANAEGINGAIAFTQAMKETAWLKFGGDVKIEQNNFAGLGTTGGGVAGASFTTVREGIRAQIQHLKAYGSKDALKNEFHWLQEEALLMWNGLVRKKIQMDMAGLQVKDMVLILKKW